MTVKNLKFILIITLLLFLTVSSLFSTEYVAFSLKVAKEIISLTSSDDYRTDYPEVFCLGGITKIHGLVYDSENDDVILVGQKDPNRSLLYLDDFVVALRARFIHDKWPVVSIDPIEQTKETNLQTVRFEGGIENTQFGVDLFDADYTLKKISMGLINPGVEGLKTNWDLNMERLRKLHFDSSLIHSRFWFYPVLPGVKVDEDVVTIKGLELGVFTEVLNAEINGTKIEDLSTFTDESCDIFAKAMSDNFEALSKVHPSLLRLRGLNELVALTKAIQEMQKRPDFSFYLIDYKVKKIETKKKLEVLKRYEEFKKSEQGIIYDCSFELSGGVELMAIALRIKSGDVTALKEAVLKTRPETNSLNWSFIVGEWLIPSAPGMFNMEDIVPLFTQARFLHDQKHYNDAITLYGNIIELKPDWYWFYTIRGIAYDDNGQYKLAISDYNKSLELYPNCADTYGVRGSAYMLLGELDQAISDIEKSIELEPINPAAINVRGLVKKAQGNINLALNDFNYAIKLGYKDAYVSLCGIYMMTGDFEKGLEVAKKTVEFIPEAAESWSSRAFFYGATGNIEQAKSDIKMALSIDPDNPEVWFIKATIHYVLKEKFEAIKAMKKYLKISLPYMSTWDDFINKKLRELENE